MNEIEQARERIRISLDGLKFLNMKAKGFGLADYALAVSCADSLLSAVTFIYDAMYEESKARGLIGRTLQNPLTAAGEENK
jgi:hypothetical protein